MDLIKLLPAKYQKLHCFIFYNTDNLENRKTRAFNFFNNSENLINHFDGHGARSCIVHFINLDQRLINIKYSTPEERTLHTVELFFHEIHHAYQVTYEGEIDTEVSTIDHPLEIDADTFAKEQMILNKSELSRLLGVNEEKIEQFANNIRKNKDATD